LIPPKYKDHQMLFVIGPNMRQMTPKWRTAAILLKVNKLPYLGNG